MAPALAVAGMVVLAVLFVTEASRRGTGRMLASTAVAIAWLAVTAAAVRSANPIEAGDAARNYAVVMGVALLAYFGSEARRPGRPSSPAP